MWPFKFPQEAPLQQEVMALNVMGVCSFSVNGSRRGDCAHVPGGVGEGNVRGSFQRCYVGWSSGCFFV